MKDASEAYWNRQTSGGPTSLNGSVGTPTTQDGSVGAQSSDADNTTSSF